MKGTEFRKTLVGVITISLSFALGMTLYNAFLIADMDDLEKNTLSSDKKTTPTKPLPTKQPMKNVSGHGNAVSDKKDDSKRQTQNKEMVQSAPASQMLG
jgi:hypothetical protein|tara:strand:- start:1644 stop:1940 length:297 start_codon:yes stop_codon:yes gene_type:complete